MTYRFLSRKFFLFSSSVIFFESPPCAFFLCSSSSSSESPMSEGGSGLPEPWLIFAFLLDPLMGISSALRRLLTAPPVLVAPFFLGFPFPAGLPCSACRSEASPLGSLPAFGPPLATWEPRLSAPLSRAWSFCEDIDDWLGMENWLEFGCPPLANMNRPFAASAAS